MQQSIGEIIRQVRQQRHLTQRELAGDQFSKSYVSAVEHNRIRPSPKALHILAERLGLPDGDFAALRERVQAVEQMSVLQASPALPESNGQSHRDKLFTLLNTLLEQTEISRFSPRPVVPVLAPDVLASLPPQMQSRYFFLIGLDAKEKRHLPEALRAFESALALAPAHQQALILDEIGNIYVLMHASLTALGYYLHARDVLSQASFTHNSTLLSFQVELHCGDAYRQLGAYQHALEHYERAHMQLKAQHDLAAAGHLYEGLGYCTYGAIYPATALSASSFMHIPLKAEQIEREFQRAISFLLQSRNFYQVAGESLKEANARLMLVSLLLDLSTWQRRMVHEKARHTEKQETLTNCLALLNDAEEHCHHVLLGWQHPGERDEVPAPEIESSLYGALTSLIRISLERAILAGLEGSTFDVAYRERAFAASLCLQVLETLSMPSLPWALIHQAVHMSAETLEYCSPDLLHFTEMPPQFSHTLPHRLLSHVEVYFAVGEVAEELGRASLVQHYAQDCYVQANQYFQAALSLAHSERMKEERDPGYLARLYLRCTALLEERAFASPALSEQTTKAFLGVLKHGIWHLQSLVPEKKPEREQEHGERANE
jgi:transcriptional regulator with XRE-family HTH domain